MVSLCSVNWHCRGPSCVDTVASWPIRRRVELNQTILIWTIEFICTAILARYPVKGHILSESLPWKLHLILPATTASLIATAYHFLSLYSSIVDHVEKNKSSQIVERKGKKKDFFSFFATLSGYWAGWYFCRRKTGPRKAGTFVLTSDVIFSMCRFKRKWKCCHCVWALYRFILNAVYMNVWRLLELIRLIHCTCLNGCLKSTSLALSCFHCLALISHVLCVSITSIVCFK